MANIQKRNGSYLIRVSAGYDMAGKQIMKSMTWKPPEDMSEKKADKEARHQAALFEERVRTGQVANGNIKFCDFAERWFTDYAEVQLRPTTINRYRDLMTRILPAFGHMPMEKIMPVHLMAFYKNLSTVPISTKVHCKIDFKEYLKQQGVTKGKCAEDSNVSISVLTSIYHGENVERTHAKRICKTMNLDYKSTFTPVKSTKTLSPKTVLHYHRLLSSIFERAVKWQVILSNPCARVEPPKAGRTTISYLDDKEAIRMLELLKDAPTQFKCAIEILLFTGMRRGELMGLEWSDIDFENQTINIERSSLYLSDRGIFVDETKNTSSNRVIKVPRSVIRALKTMRAWQSEQRLLLQGEWQESGKIFTTKTGAPMHPDSLTKWFREFVHENDLPPVHLHSLRHTNATLNIANGVSITTVAGQLGHADATTTAKIYAHSIQSAQAAAADMMEDLLGQEARSKKAK